MLHRINICVRLAGQESEPEDTLLLMHYGNCDGRIAFRE